MRITKLNIPCSEQTGLGSIAMERLGDIVILSGKNGSGKTRLLDGIQSFRYELEYQAEDLGLAQFLNKRKQTHRNMSTLELLWKSCNEKGEEFSYIRAFIEKQMKPLHGILKQFTLDSYDDIPQLKAFVPKALELISQNYFSKNQMAEHERNAKTSSILRLNEAALSYIQVMQDRWYNVTHQNYSGDVSVKEKCILEYNQICEMIKVFLDAKLTRNENGDAVIFGFPIGKAKMSEGQRVLLQFCVAFHAQADNLSKIILLMDEPENHLHPSAMLDVINKLREILTEGQIWIATHSIPLLANFDPACIWWMENGTVKHRGLQPEVVLQGLIGDDNRIGKMHDFLGLPATLAANRFAHQCLFKPSVSDAGQGDPQTQQIQRIVLETLEANGRLRILDFGAGRGRLIEAINEECSPEQKERIDYYAFETSPTHRKECELNIASMYDGSNIQRYFCSERELLSKLDRNSFDIIVMCNVLHEIDPGKWLSVFGETGICGSFLKSSGFILLVEDTLMPMGENAHSYGFLVLDTPELKELFSIGENETRFIASDARGDGRLKAHCIPASCVKNI